MIIYFTGTGNSRFAAEVIAKSLNDECINSFDYIKNGEKGCFNSEKPYVFVCPTYSWRIPKIFEKFIRESTFSGSKKAYFVMTCGGDIGDAQKYINNLCKEHAFKFMGVVDVEMPENYIALFYVPDKFEADKIISKSMPVLASVAAKIRESKPFDTQKISFVDKMKSGIVNDSFYKFVISAKKFRVGDNCISCGKCAAACPLNNVKLVNSRPVWGKDCTHCMACISVCPVRAIEYGSASVKRNRFYNTYKPSDFE